MLFDSSNFNFIYSLIYFITAFLVIISSLSIEINRDFSIQRSLGKYVIFFPILFLILLVGFRGLDVGTDTKNYYEILWIYDLTIDFRDEFLFNIIALCFRYLGLPFNFFLLLIAFLYYYFLYKAIKNISNFYNANILFLFFACFSFFFFQTMSINIIRQGVSLAILLYAYSLWLVGNRKTIYLVLLLLISTSFHMASIIPIILLFTSIYWNRSFSIRPLIFIYLVVILLSYFGYGLKNISPYLFEALGDNRRVSYFDTQYTDYQVGFRLQFVVFNTFFLIVSIYIKSLIYSKKYLNYYNQLLSYYILASCIFFLAFQLSFSDRWGLYSWIAIPILLCPLFSISEVKKGVRLHWLILLILIFVGFRTYL